MTVLNQASLIKAQAVCHQEQALPSQVSNRINFTFWLASLSTIVASYEFLFVLFLFSGRIKTAPAFAVLPVDFTFLTLTLSGLASLAVFTRRGYLIPSKSMLFLVLFGGFISYFLLSWLWSPNPAGAAGKVIRIAAPTVYTVLAIALIVSDSERRIKRLMHSLILFSIFFSLYWIQQWIEADFQDHRLNVGGNYLGVGRVVGLALICCWVCGLQTRERLALIGWGTLIGLFTFVLFALRGRMPALAALAGLLVGIGLVVKVLQSRRFFWINAIVYFCVGVAACGAVKWCYGGEVPLFSRMNLLLQDNPGQSANVRYTLWAASIPLWMENPILGHGVGAFPELVNTEKRYSHPHNIFLEVLVEGGMAGFALFFGVFSVALYNLKYHQRWCTPAGVLILAIFANLLLNALVSGDLNDNRLFLGSLALLGCAEIYSECRS